MATKITGKPRAISSSPQRTAGSQVRGAPTTWSGASQGTSMGSRAAWEAAAARLNAARPAPATAPVAPAAQRAAPTPIWTPQQLMDKSTFDSQYKDDDSGKGTALLDLQQQLDQANTQKSYDTTTLAKNALTQQAGNADDAAARGIADSSVRQAASYDIEAQRALQQGMVDDTFRSIQSNVNAKLQAIQDMRTSYYASYNAEGAQQGTAATANVVPADPAAAAPTGPPTAKPSTADLIKQWQNMPYTEAAGTNSRGQPGVWHHYKDGRPPVFVKD